MIQTISILFGVEGFLCPWECITEFERFQALNQEIRVTLQTVKHRDCDKKFAGG
jgi:hypothetical protein